MGVDRGGMGVGALVGGALLLVAMLVIGSVMARSLGGHVDTVGAPAVQAQAAPPAPSPFAAKDVKLTDDGPLVFTEAGNGDLFASTQKRINVVRAAVVDIGPTSTDAALDDLHARCAALKLDLATLDREPNRGVRSFVEKTHKVCEYDVPMALLRASVGRVEAMKGHSGAATTTECRRGVKAADALRDHRYDDDPDAKPMLARFSALCTG